MVPPNVAATLVQRFSNQDLDSYSAPVSLRD
jgi:hypothetical protein